MSIIFIGQREKMGSNLPMTALLHLQLMQAPDNSMDLMMYGNQAIK